MKSFKEYFLFVEERKTWGVDVIHAGKVAEFVIGKILDGSFSLFKNTIKINLPTFKLEIILKAFNNYKEEDYAAYFMPPDHDGDTAKIIIFVFEIFRKLKNYRGYPKDKLNNILQNFVKNNYSTDLFKALQHELEHAFEYNRGINIGKSGESTNDNFHNYVNRHEEVNARIVEYLYPINRLWNLYYRKGEWFDKKPDISQINYLTKRIINDFGEFDELEPARKKKFVKGVYSTLHYLWNHYEKASEQNQFNKEIKKSDLEKILKTLN